jgi:serine protease Do
MNMAAQVYNQIIKNGKVTRGGIGVKFVPSDTDKARALLKEAGVTEGVFIETVTPGGASDKAGLKTEDIIVSLNGKPVRNGTDLVDTVTATPVGTSLDIGVLRNRKRQNFRVVVGDLAQLFPEQFGTGSGEESSKAEGSAVSLGMRLENVTDQRRETLGLKEKGGVRVYSVDPDSFADDIGLLPGDVLTSINHQSINTVDDVTRVRNTLKPGDPVTFRVLRKERGPNGEWAPAFAAGTLPNAR